jgi:ATP-dependent RNA helicase DDX5/DBP2
MFRKLLAPHYLFPLQRSFCKRNDLSNLLESLLKKESAKSQTTPSSSSSSSPTSTTTGKRFWEIESEKRSQFTQNTFTQNRTPNQSSFIPSPPIPTPVEDTKVEKSGLIGTEKINFMPIPALNNKYSEFDITLTAPSSVKELPAPINDFSEIWSVEERKGLMNFGKPTTIQAVTWPVLLSGQDLIGIAETGSGKTIAYLLPAFRHVIKQKKVPFTKVLVISPTRELTQQISQEFQKFSPSFGNFRSAVLYGGAPKGPQARQLSVSPEFIFCTPGRLLDFNSDRIANINRTSFVVLDEADRLLDMGFGPAIEQIIERTNPGRQTVMFSATWPREVQEMARKFQTNPVRLTVGNPNRLAACSNITQLFYFCEPHQKNEILQSILNQIKSTSGGRVLVFCNTKYLTETLSNQFNSQGFNSAFFNGDMEQRQRESVLHGFRVGRYQVLFASDAAQRGLDVKDVSCVVNYDFPRDIESYVHRIGRTGRAGSLGNAVSLFTSVDIGLATSLVDVLKESKQNIPPELEDMVKFKRESTNTRGSTTSRFR